jgi:hypothetical protein
MQNSSADIPFFPQTNTSRWEIELRDAKFVDIGKNITTSFWVNVTQAVVDTFFRVVTLPMPEYYNFKAYV